MLARWRGKRKENRGNWVGSGGEQGGEGMRGRGALLPLVLFSVSIKRLFCKISEGERAGGRVPGTKLDGVTGKESWGWGVSVEGGLDGLQEPARGGGRAKNTDWEEAGQDTVGQGQGPNLLPAPLVGLPRAPVPPPTPSYPPST